MKKFRPANGSFSQFYGDKISMGKNNGSKKKVDLSHVSDLNLYNFGHSSALDKAQKTPKSRFIKLGNKNSKT